MEKHEDEYTDKLIEEARKQIQKEELYGKVNNDFFEFEGMNKKELEKKIKEIKRFSDHEMCDFLIDLFDSKAEDFKQLLKCDFLSEPDILSRTYKIIFTADFCYRMEMYNITFVKNEVRDLLYKKNECDILEMLGFLNYINDTMDLDCERSKK